MALVISEGKALIKLIIIPFLLGVVNEGERENLPFLYELQLFYNIIGKVFLLFHL